MLTFSQSFYLIIMHFNEIHIYNGNYKKIQSLFEFELQIDCLNPTFFSSNQSPESVVVPGICISQVS